MSKERGRVLFYSDETGEGLIISPAKKKYRFEVADWNDFEMMPQKGVDVLFEADENLARSIEHIGRQEDGDSSEKSETVIQDSALRKKTLKKPRAFRYKDEELTKTEEEMLTKIKKYEQSVDTIGENLKLSISIHETMKRYFDEIKSNIQKREGYKKVEGRLDYLLAKRFLWTTFNNLVEIDPHIVTLRIKSISDDLQIMSRVYNDFERKTLYPSIAFEEIFLTNQKEYETLAQLNKKIKEKLNSLKTNESSISSMKQAKTEELKRISKKNSKEYHDVLKELKIINGTYADIVHMIAKLQEEYTHNYNKLVRFANKYKSEFYDEFKKESKKYKATLVEILNAQAYLLDTLLWREAKTSKAILSYFDKLPIDVELNTKGYLKYYLNTLDEGKSTQNTKELVALYEYLQEVQKDCILILMESVQDAIEFEKSIQRSCQEMKVKAFIDEVAAFKWAMSNHIKVIVLEEYINSIDAKKFLDFYHNAILSKPKIILLGDTQHISSSKYCVTKQLSVTSSAKRVADTVCEVLQL